MRSTTVSNVDFATEKLYSREQLVEIATDVYNLHGLRPTLNSVTLSDKSTAIVPSFAIKTMLLLILNDPTCMRPENIAQNYNPFTGRPTAPVTHIDEIHTGWAWELARAHYCGDEIDVLPLGLICLYDKTHSDLVGSLSCSPFICVPSFFNLDCRCDTDFWFILGVRIRRTLLFRADPDMISKFEISAFSLAKPINQLTFSPKRPLPSTILSVYQTPLR